MSQPLPQSLPLRANLEWLKKLCKERLAAMRAGDPQAKLGDAQLAVAREYGFSSWRKLKEYVERVRDTLSLLVPATGAQAAAAAEVPPDDPDLAQLLAAVEAGDAPAVTQILCRRPMLAAARGPDGQTPLHMAAQCNDARVAVYLMAFGADPQAKYGQSGHTPLSWAVTCNALDFARTLVRLGIEPDLFCAAGIGAIEHVQACFDEAGTLLPGAARTGSSRLAADGSRLPCPPQTPREQISDALYIACRNAQAEVVRFLLTKQPDLSFRAYLGGTPLHWAYFGGSRAIIEMLERAGADPTALDDALRCAPRAFGICVPANWGFLPHLVHERLADDPALANLMDGHTSALHEAARGGHVEIVRILLAAGADPRLRDGGGTTPLDLAAARGHAGVVDLLQRATSSGGGTQVRQ